MKRKIQIKLELSKTATDAGGGEIWEVFYRKTCGLFNRFGEWLKYDTQFMDSLPSCVFGKYEEMKEKFNSITYENILNYEILIHQRELKYRIEAEDNRRLWLERGRKKKERECVIKDLTV